MQSWRGGAQGRGYRTPRTGEVCTGPNGPTDAPRARCHRSPHAVVQHLQHLPLCGPHRLDGEPPRLGKHPQRRPPPVLGKLPREHARDHHDEVVRAPRGGGAAQAVRRCGCARSPGVGGAGFELCPQPADQPARAPQHAVVQARGGGHPVQIAGQLVRVGVCPREVQRQVVSRKQPRTARVRAGAEPAEVCRLEALC
ncbi:hypothetical protein DFJ74DRAFT_692120 [Hyaloraphidium curvatum]|nr:hypothetical protein DFJ74DRAFT_692120 [Hyaloraphidium curvatum]